MKVNASFVSLTDAFKPEDAASVSTSETERNWNTVFAEAVHVRDPPVTELPVAQVVNVDGELVEPDTTSKIETDPSITSNLLVLVVGYACLIFAATAAFGTELASVTVYFVAVGFYQASEALKKCGFLMPPLRPLLVSISMILLAVDLLVLTIGILVVEVVGWAASVACVLLGGFSAGQAWHQHIRKVCHLIRWAFRGFHDGWEPQRLQLFGPSEHEHGGGDKGVDDGSGDADVVKVECEEVDCEGYQEMSGGQSSGKQESA